MSGPNWFTDTVIWPTLDRASGQPSFVRADLQAMPQHRLTWHDIEALLRADQDVDDDTFKGVAKDIWNLFIDAGWTSQVPTLREGRVGAAGPRNGTASHRPRPRSSTLLIFVAVLAVVWWRR